VDFCELAVCAARREEGTSGIKLYTVKSHFHLDSCSIEHSALSSDEMSDNEFFKGIARLIPQILQLQPPA
jgi:hypothetical protein